MIKTVAKFLIRRAEQRIGVELDYTHKIAETDISLLRRYGRIFKFLDPNKAVPPTAYHVARLRGALAADCGTCVQAEINLAKTAQIPDGVISAVIGGDYSDLSAPVAAVARLADAVTLRREDDAAARDDIIDAYGDAGLIELSYAMNGAALLPGIKRAMGYATSCDIQVMRELSKHR